MSLWKERDYHVHLGGAISRELVEKLVSEGEIHNEQLVTDMHPGQGYSKISIEEALNKYRDGKGLVEAYGYPYPSLETFLTLYRAYSTHSIVEKYAAEIAAGIHPFADVRMSLACPRADEDVESFVDRAWEALMRTQEALLDTQQLVVVFNRLYYTGTKNRPYADAFVRRMSTEGSILLGATRAERYRAYCVPRSEAGDAHTLRAVFDFAGPATRVPAMLALIQHVRQSLPQSFIMCHHGELVADLPVDVRVADAGLLVDLIDRMGHAVCLGVSLQSESTRAAASEVLARMAEAHVGVEVNPTCNLSLGGATSLGYVREFLQHGVHVFVGTDDPGFLGTTLEEEGKVLQSALEEQV